MKNLYFLIGILVTTGLSSQSRVLKLTLNSHNETNDPAFGVNYNDAQDWADVKTKLNMIVDTIEFYGARYNLQCESNFILANLNHENAATVTTDFLETMENHSQIEVDPHNHLDLDNTMNPNYNPYNYADLAKLLDSCGITRVTTVGGYIYLNSDWANPTYDNWTNWDLGLDGYTFPNYTWTPTVLWGGGTGNHVNDPFSLGLWRPAGPTALQFINHSTSNLPAIGNGCEWVIQSNTDIDSMITAIQTHVNYFQNTLAADADMFISGSVVFNLRHILTNGYAEKVCEFIRKMDPMIQAGTVEWKNIYEKYLEWDAAHPNTTDNYILFCADLTGLGVEENNHSLALEVYPNPASQNFTIKFLGDFSFEILDMTGRSVMAGTATDQIMLNTKSINQGNYLIRCFTNTSSTTSMMVIE